MTITEQELGEIRKGNLPPLLKAISLINSVVGILENKWQRPQSEFENAVIRQLQEAQEIVRQVHVEQQSKESAHE